ncbi:MAG: alpha/beta hydrolase [Flavobacteriales bacterium]|nr:alpha/beta hydrolase [Flavobacteriales bacterium]MCB0784158.1 alpha/beta hydrolase [Flavobacteriales bacterium]MCB0812862.1 alpha/beta hydrolase [Flavobacteriales bacterium]
MSALASCGMLVRVRSVSAGLFILGLQAGAQVPDSLVAPALERYPMLSECTIPDFPEKVLCGTLEVYENYSTQKGKRIPIDVIVLPSRSLEPSSSAFTLHWGGNGDAARNKIWFFRPGGAADVIRSTRDVVLMDDRGTGASNIRCAAMDSLKPYSYAFVYDRELILDCLDEVQGKVDLDLYDTPGVVRDYDQVRDWLGLDQLDFFGISYGVRVGLEYLRSYPESIRTLTVKGCVPPDFNYVNEMDLAIQEQLEILFQRCKEDTLCGRYYPDFRKELYEVRDRLKEAPVAFEYDLGNGTSKNITIDDVLFRRVVGHLILGGNANERLPFYVHLAHEGSYIPLILAGGGLTLDMPVFLSQFCPEEVDRVEYDRAEVQPEKLFTQGAIAEEKKFACDLWPRMPQAQWLDEPLKGNAPILILTGENDANTPVRMGERVRKAFPESSRHIILPHQGHASMETKCQYGLIAQFVDSQELQGLDTACLATMGQAGFVYEQALSDVEFEKYTGSYTSNEPGTMLEVYQQNGVHYLRDEFSVWTGPAQLLYRGDHTFTAIDCGSCKLTFEMDEGAPVRVSRAYRDTVVFEPKARH